MVKHLRLTGQNLRNKNFGLLKHKCWTFSEWLFNGSRNKNFTSLSFVVRKVKQPHYGPGGAQRVPGSQGSKISWQWHRMVVGCQPYAPAAFTPRKCSRYSFLLEAESTPRKDFMSMKNPLTFAGIKPATFRFVTHQLNHCATAVPFVVRMPSLY